MANKLNTIEWLIKYVGDHKLAIRHQAIADAKLAGHYSGTIELYLGSAEHYGHVTPAGNCKHTKRAAYFERVSRGKYKLSPAGKARYILIQAWGAEELRRTMNKDSGVNATEVGYNGNMERYLKMSDYVDDMVTNHVGGDIRDAYIDLVKSDQGYSYESVLYLTIEFDNLTVSQVTELAEDLEVHSNDINIYHGEFETKVTFVSPLEDSKWWLQSDPMCNAPYAGMEFETPDNFDANHF